MNHVVDVLVTVYTNELGVGTKGRGMEGVVVYFRLWEAMMEIFSRISSLANYIYENDFTNPTAASPRRRFASNEYCLPWSIGYQSGRLHLELPNGISRTLFESISLMPSWRLISLLCTVYLRFERSIQLPQPF